MIADWLTQRNLDMCEYDPIDANADQAKKGWLTAILDA